ncbi:YbaN family protein [Pseudoalteromonas sp. DL2-H2.2]|uniref:YbaN family protein n=1 Tax=Pseudoalteromonas sp. DL2-H2.2 TaxID=2908889 RepID=UPI001F2F3B1E|nr:YbaN family protein [Pseudoalteromonas sp. DL2-H2.2]MCF2907583.1 YbaN family protein [Pseudoalteromonas sp. DL2-H2.2]
MLGGYVALILAFIGAILPVMPTTVFLIIALWCFTRSSSSLETWLLTHPRFGEALQNWRTRQVIPKKAKYFAASSMLTSLLVTCYLYPLGWLQTGLFFVCAFVCNYLFAKPSKPTDMTNQTRYSRINVSLIVSIVCVISLNSILP